MNTKGTMMLSKQVGSLQSQLDRLLPSRWIWIAGELQEIGVQAGNLESQNAKLLQAVNDKDQELFESQELVAELKADIEKYRLLIIDCPECYGTLKSMHAKLTKKEPLIEQPSCWKHDETEYLCVMCQQEYIDLLEEKNAALKSGIRIISAIHDKLELALVALLADTQEQDDEKS